MSLGDIATCESIRVAGDDLDEAIITYMKKNHSLTIGEQTAERIKIEVGSASPMEKETKIDVRGRDNITGMPDKKSVKSQEIRAAMSEPIEAIIEVVKRTLERAEPELSADLVENGIYIAGGGAELRGIDTVIAEATGLDVTIADDPLTCVAKGTSIYLDNLELWKSVLESDMDG
jgi:rod shape-determining protein MreB